MIFILLQCFFAFFFLKNYFCRIYFFNIEMVKNLVVNPGKIKTFGYIYIYIKFWINTLHTVGVPIPSQWRLLDHENIDIIGKVVRAALFCIHIICGLAEFWVKKAKSTNYFIVYSLSLTQFLISIMFPLHFYPTI
jgi:hypothetical protein